MKNRNAAQIALRFLFIVCVFNFNVDAYVTTKGKYFVDRKSGDTVILRGFGLGGWLLPEGYMWGIRKIDRPRQFQRAIEEIIGKEKAEKFWKLYYENYVTEEDIAAMKSWGVNSIRVPILASFLQPEEQINVKPPYIYSEYGFSRLDSIVSWCSKYQVGIIWDMHGAPGSQNAENISDSDGEAKLWSQPEIYWPRCKDLWFQIAKRYKNKECIIGYDLLNEPLLIRYGFDPSLLRKLYIELTSVIRLIDTEGVIFVEGDDWAQNFDMLEPLDWDKHLAVAFHSYPPVSDSVSLDRWAKLRDKYNIPLWHGETGEQGPPYTINIKATKFLEKQGVSWSWWTHKKFDRETQPWSIIRTKGFLKILEYWNGKAEKPSGEDAEKWLFEQAVLTNSKYCNFLPEMVKSLYPLNPQTHGKK